LSKTLVLLVGNISCLADRDTLKRKGIRGDDDHFQLGTKRKRPSLTPRKTKVYAAVGVSAQDNDGCPSLKRRAGGGSSYVSQLLLRVHCSALGSFSDVKGGKGNFPPSLEKGRGREFTMRFLFVPCSSRLTALFTREGAHAGDWEFYAIQGSEKGGMMREGGGEREQ